MAYFNNIDIDLFSLGDLGTFTNRDITETITNLSVSLTISGSSEVSFSVIDPDFKMAKANYFQIRRDAFYKKMIFEITAIETSRSEGIHPTHKLECRSKAIQLMKRDKRPEAFNGISGYDLAKRMALRYNMNFVGQQDAKKQATVKSNSGTTDDSVWSVLQAAAGEQEFVCFESENTLFYASEKWLLGKWGDSKFAYGDIKFIPFIYPEATVDFLPEAIDKYVLIDMPTIRRSDDDYRAASGSMIVDRANGVFLRPGMTIFIGGIHSFDGFYLITDVQFDEGTFEPVQVKFRTPVDPNKENISSDGTVKKVSVVTGGGEDNPIGVPDTEESNKFVIEFDNKKVTDVKQYVNNSLRHQQYTGTEGNLIQDAVEAAVKALNNGKSTDYASSIIKNFKGLSSINKTIAENILWGFMFGIPVNTYAVAGGLSADAFAKIKEGYINSIDSSKTSITPAKGATDSSGSGGLTEVIFGPAQKYPELVNTYIDEYISNKWTGSIVSSEKDSLKTRAKIQASIIYSLTTKNEKIKKYNELKKSYSVAPNSFIYFALRQEKVVKLLIPPYDESKSFNENYYSLSKS